MQTPLGELVVLVVSILSAGFVLLLGCGEEPSSSSQSYRPLPSKEQVGAADEAGVEPLMEIDVGNGVTMRMVLIPAGTFAMISAPGMATVTRCAAPR